jgi:CRP-like cAMP-binding protein
MPIQVSLHMFDVIIGKLREHITLSDDETKLFSSYIEVRKLRKNQLLVEPPYPATAEHFITRGCLRSYFLDANGTEYTLGFATEGWWMTDLQSFFTGAPSTYHVEALEEGEVLSIKKQDQEELFKKIPALNIYFRILYQNAIISQGERILNSLSTTADERYLRFVKKYPTIENRVPQYLIASYLGITPEFLSKVKTRIAAKR